MGAKEMSQHMLVASKKYYSKRARSIKTKLYSWRKVADVLSSFEQCAFLVLFDDILRLLLSFNYFSLARKIL